MISAAQCRSARALLGWSVTKLASAASVSASAIDDFEAERRAPRPAIAGPIRRAFEPLGVAFLPGEDVRLRPGALFEVDGDSAPSRAADPQKPRLTAGVIWRDHALKIFGTAVLLTSALAITAGPAFALQEPVRQNSAV